MPIAAPGVARTSSRESSAWMEMAVSRVVGARQEHWSRTAGVWPSRSVNAQTAGGRAGWPRAPSRRTATTAPAPMDASPAPTSPAPPPNATGVSGPPGLSAPSPVGVANRLVSGPPHRGHRGSRAAIQRVNPAHVTQESAPSCAHMGAGSGRSGTCGWWASASSVSAPRRGTTARTLNAE